MKISGWQDVFENTWVRRYPVSLPLLVGLILRLIHIQGREIQYDDTFSIFLAERSLGEIVHGTAADTMPPLYYFVLHYWMILGRDVWFLRLLSVLIGLGVILLLYSTVKLWFGQTAALWAALLAAISPLQIYHSQDIRMYALLVLGQMGYIYSFTRLWFGAERGETHWVDWLGLVVSGLIALYSHNLAVFGLVVPNLFLIIKGRWSFLFRIVVAQLVIGLGFLPWMLMLPGQLEKISRAFWTPAPGPVEVIQAVIMLAATIPLPPTAILVAAVVSFQILILLILGLVRYSTHQPGVLLLGILLLAPPVLLFILSYLMRPVFVPRGFLVSALAYDALAGFIIWRGWTKGSGKILLGAFVLAAALSLPYFYTFNEFPRSPFRQAAAYLQQNIHQGVVAVHETKLSYFPTRFYAPNLNQRFLADEPNSPNDTFALQSQEAMGIFPDKTIQAAVDGNGAVYFVTFRQVFTEYQQSGIDIPPNIEWLNAHYRLVETRSFNDLEIYHYER